MDKKLSLIMDKYWSDFVSHRDKEFIVNPSIPIIWFGNIDAYNNSKLKIVTVALNPSDKEFGKNGADSFFRFKGVERIYEKKQLSDDDRLLLKNTLSAYFKDAPYDNWFNCFEKPLNTLGSSYKNGSNIAVHIDIYSALATNPTWSGLTKEEKASLSVTDNRSLSLFKELLNYLQPDVILYSANAAELYNAFSLTKKDCDKIYPTGSKGFNIETYYYEKKLVIKGRNNYGKPFKLKDIFVKETMLQIKRDYREVFIK